VKAGERIAAVSALALLGFSFLQWYGSEPTGQAHFHTDAGGNAWQTLTIAPIVLAAAALVALAAAALRRAGSSWRPQVPLDAVVAVLGGLTALLILLRIVFPPDLGSVGGIHLDATLSLGAFLALVAACGVAYGGYRAMGEAGDSFEAIAERLSNERRVSRARG
jgi:ABC-type amino acid transport system permease subunit